MTLICGFYLIFDLGFHPISLISIAILASISILQMIAFVRCKVSKAENQKEKPKWKFKNNKALSIINLVLIALFVVIVIIQFCYKCQVNHHQTHTCCYDIVTSTLGLNMLICCCLVLLYQIINNIVLLKSSEIATSKYGFVSKIVCAVFSLVYVVFGWYCLAIKNIKPTDCITLAMIVGVLVVIISTLQVILSREK